MDFKYDVIVIGAGHAGCEAAAAAANLGSKTCLITMDMNKIAQMSCNPAIGGIAKGQIVREIDALGGYTGLITDKTAIQFRMLNRSKGPAMWSPRAQCDRGKFIWAWREVLENIPNLHIWQDTVTELIVKDKEVIGLKTEWDVTFHAKTIILTAGTFLNGLMHVGRTKVAGGRIAEPASYKLTESIAQHGIQYDRMKTGTPVRIDGRSVRYDLMEKQDGESDFHKFSFMNIGERQLKQLNCWTCFTNEEVHEVLRVGLPDSPLFNGQIQSIGPRYCPSIETKIVTFPEKEQHQLFLEPEGESTQEYYLNGFSSSLPLDIQLGALKKIPAFKDLVLYRPGYAIEYDFFDPTQLTHTLESKVIRNLFFAGQVNGTTGYEEAAGQGIIAGINAHINCHGGNAFTLGRDEAYIGVLIDDLVTKGVDEPYRMFTSRAEYRILLRQDDADVRLTPKATAIGLATKERSDLLAAKQEAINSVIEFAESYSIKPALINDTLELLGTTPLQQGCKLITLINRPQITLTNIAEHIPAFKRVLDKIKDRKEEVIEAAEIQIKYKGYIDRERMIANKLSRLENIKIKGKFDYANLQSLSTEARQKLAKINPETIAQASRIPGVSPSDINVLLVLASK
ncbi:tRNA uridine-5-carboxymethylaminomethyl(34) synthesis enzyme MnmG [Bacteroides sp. 214]|uniref:tRNA uridine-5-carboxymethylaminomethyl(34) synthesis enzyme MnmG n=1 Tax=Bacteroides sp. 214 TaxID=2302935 RepID=UPI0013CF9CC3|nr:tRNA uridine-5-carboxymethylaminomethyl(34) synthesis enzyme MnmG [Bacteroides sp. 214]NDW12112.1 tRNA uridine-5-carboxymethylaminomethyl(34) synthesis enzyme MnmG [Bacteroides sp. 214]